MNFYVGTVEPRFSGALKIIILQKISANCKKKNVPEFLREGRCVCDAGSGGGGRARNVGGGVKLIIEVLIK